MYILTVNLQQPEEQCQFQPGCSKKIDKSFENPMKTQKDTLKRKSLQRNSHYFSFLLLFEDFLSNRFFFFVRSESIRAVFSSFPHLACSKCLLLPTHLINSQTVNCAPLLIIRASSWDLTTRKKKYCCSHSQVKKCA